MLHETFFFSKTCGGGGGGGGGNSTAEVSACGKKVKVRKKDDALDEYSCKQ